MDSISGPSIYGSILALSPQYVRPEVERGMCRIRNVEPEASARLAGQIREVAVVVQPRIRVADQMGSGTVLANLVTREETLLGRYESVCFASVQWTNCPH